MAARRGSLRSAMCRPMSSSFTIRPTDAIDADGDDDSDGGERGGLHARDCSLQLASAMAMISADRMKSVRIAPVTCSFSSSLGSSIASISSSS